MTNSFMKKLRTATGGLLALVLCTGFPTLSNAAVLQIQFTGLDLVYDGTNIFDAKSLPGGTGNPSDSDPLITMSFLEDGVLLGTLVNDIYADIFIAGVSNIPVGGGMVSSSGIGFFDLLTSSSNPGWGLGLILDSPVQVVYAEKNLTVQGSATTNKISNQNLPFNLTAATPVQFSFTLTGVTAKGNGTYLTSFSGAGTGVVVAPSVPEPSVLLLMDSGLVALGFARIRRRTEGV